MPFVSPVHFLFPAAEPPGNCNGHGHRRLTTNEAKSQGGFPGASVSEVKTLAKTGDLWIKLHKLAVKNRGFCGNLGYFGGDERILLMLYQEFYHAICLYKDPVLNQPSIMTCQQGFFVVVGNFQVSRNLIVDGSEITTEIAW